MINIKELVAWTTKHYTSGDLNFLCEDAICNYLDDDWDENGCYETEYDWYQDYGSNEVEYEIFDRLICEIEKHFKLSKDALYSKEYNEVCEEYSRYLSDETGFNF